MLYKHNKSNLILKHHSTTQYFHLYPFVITKLLNTIKKGLNQNKSLTLSNNNMKTLYFKPINTAEYSAIFTSGVKYKPKNIVGNASNKSTA